MIGGLRPGGRERGEYLVVAGHVGARHLRGDSRPKALTRGNAWVARATEATQ